MPSIRRWTRSSYDAERVLAQHGALRLVVELEVHPVDGEVAAALLGARMNSPRRRARVVCGGTDLASKIFRSLVTRVDRPALLEQVVEAATAVDVVVGEVELGDPRVAERQAVLRAVALDAAST